MPEPSRPVVGPDAPVPGSTATSSPPPATPVTADAGRPASDGPEQPTPGTPLADQPVERVVTRRRYEMRALLEIAAGCGLVIAQPLLDITGRSPDFFLFHGARPGEILALVGLITVLPPVLLWGAGALLGLLGSRVRAVAHTVTVGLLFLGLAIQVSKHLLDLRGVGLMLLAGVLGAALLYAYRRWSALGQLLRVAAVGPLVFMLLFIFASPASAVVLPSRQPAPTQAATVTAGSHPPVVVLVLDEFPLVSILGPDGSVDADRYPNLARLAGESTWYRNATAVSGWTPYALPAILTGRFPPGREQAPHYSQYPENLFTAFGGSHELRVQESITQLCPPASCPERVSPAGGSLPVLLRESGVLLGQLLAPSEAGARDPEQSFRETTRGEAGQSPPTDPTFRWDRLDENQPARFTRFLEDLTPGDGPTLHFLHVLLPHSPWNYLPSGVRYDSPDGMRNEGDGWVSLAHQRHLAQVEYTDRLIGQTMRRLAETGLYDDALVVVTADHGVSFTPGVQGRGREAVDRAPAEVLWVPMFLKRPGQRTGEVDDRNWQQVDLLPTMAELTGVELPWDPDGRSASGEPRSAGDKQYHDQPGQALTIDGSRVFAELLAGTARPPAPARSELVGRDVAALTVTDADVSATVANRADYDQVDPAGGTLPALIHGTVADSVPSGTRLAVALNGRIAAVCPVVDPDPGGRRFAALLPAESLFVPGANRVELFLVAEDGGLRRLRS